MAAEAAAVTHRLRARRLELRQVPRLRATRGDQPVLRRVLPPPPGPPPLDRPNREGNPVSSLVHELDGSAVVLFQAFAGTKKK